MRAMKTKMRPMAKQCGDGCLLSGVFLRVAIREQMGAVCRPPCFYTRFLNNFVLACMSVICAKIILKRKNISQIQWNK